MKFSKILKIIIISTSLLVTTTCMGFWKNKTFVYQNRQVQDAQKSIVMVSSGGASSTGIVISENKILGVFHGIADDTNIKIITFENKNDIDESFRVTKAKLIKFDKKRDLCLVKTEKPLLNVIPIHFRKTTLPAVGDSVYSVGYSLADRAFFSRGVISQYFVDELGIFGLETDLSINLGNSGSPIFDSNGDVIGIMRGVLKNNYSQTVGDTSAEIEYFLSVKE